MERRRQPDSCTWHDRHPPAQETLVELSEEELEAELTIAAWAPGRQRLDRYQRLLAERRRRGACRLTAG
jgi:hypothetical protein